MLAERRSRCMSASRWRSWSPTAATSPRTRRRWWRSITRRCPRVAIAAHALSRTRRARIATRRTISSPNSTWLTATSTPHSRRGACVRERSGSTAAARHSIECRGVRRACDDNAREARRCLELDADAARGKRAARAICSARREPGARHHARCRRRLRPEARLLSAKMSLSRCGAMLLGRPVKWIEDRREHFVATTQERDQYWDIEIAVDARRAHARHARALIHDHGAYTARGVNAAVGSPRRPSSGLCSAGLSASNIKVAMTNKVPDAGARRRTSAGHVSSWSACSIASRAN